MSLSLALSARRGGRLVGLVLVAFAAAVVALGGGPGGSRVAAHSPHPGLDFSIGIDSDGDTTDDCSTKAGQPAKCLLSAGSTFRLKVYLNSLGGVSYKGFDLGVEFSGVGSKNNPDASPWPDCVFEAIAPHPPAPPNVEAWGCVIGVFAGPSTYTGLIGTADFNCTGGGTIAMFHHDGVSPPPIPPYTAFTDLLEDVGPTITHAEGQSVRETLTINCLAVGGISHDPDVGTLSVTAEQPSSGFGSLASVIAGATAGTLALSGAAWYARRRRAR